MHDFSCKKKERRQQCKYFRNKKSVIGFDDKMRFGPKNCIRRIEFFYARPQYDHIDESFMHYTHAEKRILWLEKQTVKVESIVISPAFTIHRMSKVIRTALGCLSFFARVQILHNLKCNFFGREYLSIFFISHAAATVEESVNLHITDEREASLGRALCWLYKAEKKKS